MKNNIIKKLSVPTSKIVKRMAVFSANSVSPLCLYQPVEPKEMRKFKK
ncbi:MAG: cyclic lactone autoinducer peptide [Oscillospiraceae bacterium]|nr:cyclic lactone autoinducer peptide [Oscillospiraceae bacterium]